MLGGIKGGARVLAVPIIRFIKGDLSKALF